MTTLYSYDDKVLQGNICVIRWNIRKTTLMPLDDCLECKCGVIFSESGKSFKGALDLGDKRAKSFAGTF